MKGLGTAWQNDIVKRFIRVIKEEEVILTEYQVY